MVLGADFDFAESLVALIEGLSSYWIARYWVKTIRQWKSFGELEAKGDWPERLADSKRLALCLEIRGERNSVLAPSRDGLLMR